MDEARSIIKTLSRRENGSRVKIRLNKDLPRTTKNLINSEFNNILQYTAHLSNAMASLDWTEIESSVGDLIINLLDNSNPNQMFAVTPKRKQQREVFVSIGGMDLLIRLMSPPFAASDARRISAEQSSRKSDLWNEILVIIREVAFTIPSLSNKLFSDQFIVFLFTLLTHQSVFDNTMNLLEELLATKDDIFCLALIPDVQTLLTKFSARHFAHFCRVLSLVLFEPEDRQMMEGSHVVRSMELLQLRRNRMAKTSNGKVERNQSLIIEAPTLLPRLVQMLRIINYGPSLTDLINHNIVTQMPITNDILTFVSNSSGISDWDHFTTLENILTLPTASPSNYPPPVTTNSRGRGGTTHPESTVGEVPQQGRTASRRRPGAEPVDDDDEATNMAELLNAFSPNSVGGGANRLMELNNIINVMQVARGLGIADMTPLGEALLMQRFPGGPDPGGFNQTVRRANRGSRAVGERNITPRMAKKELQFHAMLLAPHQIELLFVLCTLLSGRRKVFIQQKFAQMGFHRVLNRMFDRMSWDAPPFAGRNPMEHIHGPDCECNPESAVRVQFLRLIHNFYDRDFLGNMNKLLILSPSEQAFVLEDHKEKRGEPKTEGENMLSEREGEPSLMLLIDDGEISLLQRIIQTLLKEPVDSVYRFWLSACLENFLRGCGVKGQLLVAHKMLRPTLEHILKADSNSNNTLQTSFDLMGEMVKCNRVILENLEENLSDAQFRTLMDAIMSNLVDSNVFLRSLYLSLEMLTFNGDRPSSSPPDSQSKSRPMLRAQGLEGLRVFGFYDNSIGRDQKLHLNTLSGRLGYLTDSWVQFPPEPVSRRAIELYNPQSEHRVYSGEVGKAAVVTAGRKKHSKPKFEHHSSHRVNLDFNDEGHNAAGMTAVPRPPTTLSTSSPNGNPLSTLRNGVLGAFKATSNFWRFGDSPAGADRGKGSKEAEEEEDEGVYQTPPEEPKYPRSHSKHNSASSYSSIQSKEPAGNDALSSCESEKMRTPLQNNEIQTHDTPASGFAIQRKIFRLSMFLLQEKTKVLLRLMSIVSLRTINHENICCLNTALLMLLLEHQRGNLANCLSKIKNLARQEYKSQEFPLSELDSTSLDGPPICFECGGSAATTGELKSPLPSVTGLTTEHKQFSGSGDFSSSGLTSSAASSNRGSRRSPWRKGAACLCCEPLSPVPTTPTSAEIPEEEKGNSAVRDAGVLVFRNFRELLWYWREYYLRRGRDRLSIEFSSHIPFHHWGVVVDLLCKDDGSPTALLSEGIVLPLGPYHRPLPGEVRMKIADQQIIAL